MKAFIKVWHLELLSKPEISTTARQYELKQALHPLPELNRFLYASVGAPWYWYMRLKWSYRQWQDYLSRDNVETWIAFQGASPIGYFELERQAAGSTEIAYFGLLPAFVGKGLGHDLLEDAIATAFGSSGNRVWLHTCTLDHPAALPNYKARGFTVFREEEFWEQLPDKPMESWPGAGNVFPGPDSQ